MGACQVLTRNTLGVSAVARNLPCKDGIFELREGGEMASEYVLYEQIGKVVQTRRHSEGPRCRRDAPYARLLFG